METSDFVWNENLCWLSSNNGIVPRRPCTTECKLAGWVSIVTSQSARLVLLLFDPRHASSHWLAINSWKREGVAVGNSLGDGYRSNGTRPRPLLMVMQDREIVSSSLNEWDVSIIGVEKKKTGRLARASISCSLPFWDPSNPANPDFGWSKAVARQPEWLKTWYFLNRYFGLIRISLYQKNHLDWPLRTWQLYRYYFPRLRPELRSERVMSTLPAISTLFPSSAAGSIIPHLLLPTAQILAFALPPFRYRSHIFVPIILGLIYATWSNLYSDATDMRGLMIGQWPWYLNTLEKLLFHPIPEQDCWRVGKPAQEAMSMSFFSKLKWSAALYCNPRGIGWNYQARGIPKQRAPNDKMGFLIQQIKEIAIVFLAINALDIYVLVPIRHGLLRYTRIWTLISK